MKAEILEVERGTISKIEGSSRPLLRTCLQSTPTSSRGSRRKRRMTRGKGSLPPRQPLVSGHFPAVLEAALLLLQQEARVVLGRVRRARARGRVAPLPSSSRDSLRQGPFRAHRLPINSRMLRNKGVSFPESQLGPCGYLRAAHSIMITIPSPSLASCTPIMSVDQRTFAAAFLPAPLTRGDPSIGQERRSCCASRGDATTSRSRPSSSSPRPRDPRSAAP